MRKSLILFFFLLQATTFAYLTPIGGGGGSTPPGGANTDVQYNSSGSFGGSSRFTTSSDYQRLLLGGPTDDGTTLLQANGLIAATSGFNDTMGASFSGGAAAANTYVLNSTGGYFGGNDSIQANMQFPGSGIIAFTLNGTSSAVVFSNTGIAVNGGVFSSIFGSASNPAIGFSPGMGSAAGMFQSDAGHLDFSVTGTDVFTLNATQSSISVPFFVNSPLSAVSIVDNPGAVLSIDPNTRNFYDATGLLSGDYNARTLGTGTSAVLNWNALLASDYNAAPSLDWGQRFGYDQSGILSINWGTSGAAPRQLLDTSGNESMEWGQRFLIGSNDFISLDWQNKVTYDNTSTSTPTMDYGNRILLNSGAVGVVDWQNLLLVNQGGGTTVDWSSQYLLDGNGGIIVNWFFGQLNYGGNNSIDWSGIQNNTYSLSFDSSKNSYFSNDVVLPNAGTTYHIAEINGGADCTGQALLSGGSVDISTSCTPSTSDGIFITNAGGGTLANVGALSIGVVTGGTDFFIKSSNILDNNNVNWMIIKH